jgi:hypothetical protein
MKRQSTVTVHTLATECGLSPDSASARVLAAIIILILALI